MKPQTKSRLIAWIIVSLFALIFSVLILVIVGEYTYRGFSNALFIPGFAVFAILMLRLVGNWGMFDLLGYSFNRIRHGSRKEDLSEMKTASEYIEYKAEERKKKDHYYLPYIVISLLFIGVGALFAFL